MSVGFFYGGTLVDHGMTAGEVINVFFSIIIGAFALGNLIICKMGSCVTKNMLKRANIS